MYRCRCSITSRQVTTRQVTTRLRGPGYGARKERKRCVRQITQVLRERTRMSPHVIAAAEAKTAAGRLLVEGHPSEYAFIRAELRPHEERDGLLPLPLVSGQKRAGIKHRVVAALTDGTWTRSVAPRSRGRDGSAR